MIKSSINHFLPEHSRTLGPFQDVVSVKLHTFPFEPKNKLNLGRSSHQSGPWVKIGDP